MEASNPSNGFPPLVKRSKQNEEMQTTTLPVPTFNRFGILGKLDESEKIERNTAKPQNQAERKRKAVPPIVVTRKTGNYKVHFKSEKHTQLNEFHMPVCKQANKNLYKQRRT